MSFSIVGSGTVGSMTLGVSPRKFGIYVSRFNPTFTSWDQVDITRFVLEDWEVTNQLNQPSTLTFTMLGEVALPVGQRVWVSLTAVKAGSFGEARPESGADYGDILFTGNVLEVVTELAQIGQRPRYRVTCQDMSWDLNRRGFVTGTYGSVGYNTMVGQLLEDYFAPYGSYRPFVVGYIPSSLGNAPQLTFDNVSMTEALVRIADAANAYLSIEPSTGDIRGRVNLFTEADHLTSADSITNTSRNAYGLRYYRDLTNVVTQVNVIGQSFETVAASLNGVLYVNAATAAAFSPVASPRVWVNGTIYNVSLITYATPGTEPAATLFLTGGSSLTTRVGLPFNIAGIALASPASSLVGQMTFGSNVRIFTEVNGQLSGPEVQARAVTLATRLSAGYTELSFVADDERHTLARQLSPGQRLSINITSPVSVIENETLVVQQVTVRQSGTTANSTVDITRTARAGLQYRTQSLDETLAQTKSAQR